MIVAGDMGGTNTRLALVEKDDQQRFRIREQETFPSTKYQGLEYVIQEFLAKRNLTVSRACVGVAGPVKDGRCAAMNLPWVIEARRVASVANIEHVAVINDLEASAYGIPCLGPDDQVTLNAGDHQGRWGTARWCRRARGWARPGCTGTGSNSTRSPPKAVTPTSLPATPCEFDFYQYLLSSTTTSVTSGSSPGPDWSTSTGSCATRDGARNRRG